MRIGPSRPERRAATTGPGTRPPRANRARGARGRTSLGSVTSARRLVVPAACAGPPGHGMSRGGRVASGDIDRPCGAARSRPVPPGSPTTAIAAEVGTAAPVPTKIASSRCLHGVRHVRDRGVHRERRPHRVADGNVGHMRPREGSVTAFGGAVADDIVLRRRPSRGCGVPEAPAPARWHRNSGGFTGCDAATTRPPRWRLAHRHAVFPPMHADSAASHAGTPGRARHPRYPVPPACPPSFRQKRSKSSGLLSKPLALASSHGRSHWRVLPHQA